MKTAVAVELGNAPKNVQQTSRSSKPFPTSTSPVIRKRIEQTDEEFTGNPPRKLVLLLPKFSLAVLPDCKAIGSWGLYRFLAKSCRLIDYVKEIL